MIAAMLRPWLVASTKNHDLRVGITNFRFELGILIGGFEHCDTYTDEDYGRAGMFEATGLGKTAHAGTRRGGPGDIRRHRCRRRSAGGIVMSQS